MTSRTTHPCKVTFDTTAFAMNKNEKLNMKQLYTAKFRGQPMQPYAVTTSEREKLGITKVEVPRDGYGKGLYGSGLYGGKLLKKTHLQPELYVVGFGAVGEAEIGNEQRKNNLDIILGIITKNAHKAWHFQNLTDQQCSKFNDALIFECHTHLKHDVFVSDDKKSFIHGNGEARRRLREQYSTEILTSSEFLAECKV